MKNNKKNTILMIVEGEKREIGIFNSIKKYFFNDAINIIPLVVPAAMNIYMLYSKMKEDDFETDVVEVLKENVPKAKEILESYNREDFAEVYFFFDFDGHTNNIKKLDNITALTEMISILNNETELGKLYISYPMIEALRDYIPNSCHVKSKECFRERSDFGKYKKDTATDGKEIDFKKWVDIIKAYANRCCCLFGIRELDRQIFLNNISPETIFGKQREIYIKGEKIFILSSLPEFLIDYSQNNWNNTIKKTKKLFIDKKCKSKD